MGGDFGKEGWIFVPHGDAAVVFSTLLIVNDERYDLVSQTFLHHDQPTQAAITVLKRMYPLELDMEVQDILQGNITLRLIILQQSGQCSMDLLGRCAVLVRSRPELAGAHNASTVSLRAVEEKAM